MHIRRSAKKKKKKATWDVFGKFYIFQDAESKNDLNFPPSRTVFLQNMKSLC